MITSTQITLKYTEILAFIAVLIVKLLSRKVLFIKREKTIEAVKSRLLFKKIIIFTSKLPQNYE